MSVARKASKEKCGVDKIQLEVPVYKLKDGEMINLHHELGHAEFPETGKVRFCQSINGGCFWLCVGKVGVFQIKTEHLMSAVLTSIMQEGQPQESAEIGGAV